MTNKLLSRAICATWHIEALKAKPVLKPTGFPNWLKNSNGLDLADSLGQHEYNFISSFHQWPANLKQPTSKAKNM